MTAIGLPHTIGSPMDLEAWLEKLGLAQYAPAFAANSIDATVLPHLTGADLAEMGVLPIGHRRLILNAAAQASGSAERAPFPPQAERRQLSVLFCDIVGSTALSERLDPEDMTEVITAYHAACRAVVSKYDGRIANFLGDGVIATFGYPRARENDAERAALAGLELLRATGEVRVVPGVALAARAGLDSGIVVVGASSGEAALGNLSIVGDTPNRAARLQELAEPGQLVVSEASRRLCSEALAFEDWGTRAFRGLSAETRVWRASLRAPRYRPPHAMRLPMVNRVAELDALREMWGKACLGQGQIALLEGDPGIGKTRLLEALREDLVERRHNVLTFHGSPSFETTALHTISEQLAAIAGAGSQDLDPSGRLAQFLQADPVTDAEYLEHVAELVAQRSPNDPAAGAQGDPALFKNWLFARLIDAFEAMARDVPLLLVLEDAHWADASSLDFFIKFAARVRNMPVLFVTLGRMGDVPRWRKSGAGEAVLELRPLTRSEIRQVIGQIPGAQTLPADKIESAVDLADGVPLFAAEVARALVENASKGAVGDVIASQVPPTLLDTLTARLDALGPSRDLALEAACIGKAFGLDLLAAVSRMSAEQVATGVDALVAADLVEPEAPKHFAFRHRLVQEAAQQLLLRSRRREIHARIADVLTRENGSLERIARHYQRADQPLNAARAWLRVGEQQIGVGGYREALQALGRARENLKAANDPSDPAIRLELAILVALGSAMIAVQPQAAAEIGDLYEEAYAVSRRTGPVPETGPVLFGLAVHFFFRGDLSKTEDLCGQIIALARELGEPSVAAGAELMLNQVRFWRGSIAQVRPQGDDAPAPHDTARQARQLARYAQEPRITSRITYVWSLNLSARFDEAAHELSVAQEHAERLQHSYSLAQIQQIRCWHHQVRGEPAYCLAAAEDLLDLARTHGFMMLLDIGEMHREWADAMLGGAAGGALRIERMVAKLLARGAHLAVNASTVLLAEVALKQGDIAHGLTALDRALDRGRSEDRVYRPELLRLKAELMLASGPLDGETRALLRAARDLARRDGTSLLALRAAMGLMRHAGKTEQPAQDDIAALQEVFAGIAPAPQQNDWAAAQAALGVTQTETTDDHAKQTRP